MSEQNPIRVFVTHTFSNHPDYHRVFEYLESSPNFFYKNVSDVEAAPAGPGKEGLKETYRNQIGGAEVVVVLSSLFESDQYWVTYQMDAAQAAELPIVAIEPFGGSGEVPEEVRRRAAEVVGWNERNIIDALRRQARHEDTTRWDTIEFKL
ncbi:MAG TPA: TIR domain-containing protein [Gammaproteobacteria bacterium]